MSDNSSTERILWLVLRKFRQVERLEFPLQIARHLPVIEKKDP